MHRIISSALILAIATTGYAPIAQAVGKRQISATVAERGMTVKLVRGIGVVLNFSPSGESISQAWLSDPSKVVLSSNGGLCAVSQNCTGSGSATMLYLKPIVPLAFSGLYQAGDGSSLLTVVTKGSGGDRLYQFRLVVSDGPPEYTALEIGGTPTFDPLPPPPFPTRVVRTPSVPRASSNVATLPPPPSQPQLESPSASPYVVTRPAEESPSTAALPEQKLQRKRVAKRVKVAPVSKTKQIAIAKAKEPNKTVAIAKAPETLDVNPSPSVKVPDNPSVSPLPSVKVSETTAVKPSPSAKVPDNPSVSPSPSATVAENAPPVSPKDAGKLPKEPQPQPETQQKPELPQNSNSKTKIELPVPRETSKQKVATAVAKPSVSSQPTTKPSVATSPTVPPNVEMANAIARGLPVGVSNKQISRWSWTYYQVQKAIRLLRFGKVSSLESAAQKSGLKLAVLSQVHRWGGG